MKRLVLVPVIATLCGTAVLAAEVPKVAPEGAPKVEVAFVLDTTGSMSGLIAGAKAKIWYIANQIVLGDPKPTVRIALVPFRDKGDKYVTQVFDLTDNIDEVYTNLMKFKADGGGDTPENVNQALHDAVHKLSWSPAEKTLRIIYLVGDSPPHNEYKDVPAYDKIAQDGGVREIPTPYDDELARLNRELLATALVYGSKVVRTRQAKLNQVAMGYSAPAAAERASFSVSAGKVASNDLVDDLRKNRVKLGDLDKDMLPEAMQKMSPEGQRKLIAENQAKRDGINEKIRTVSAQRNDYLKKELSKAKGGKKGFDLKVLDALKVQAARKDISYK